jgi:GST-like protein
VGSALFELGVPHEKVSFDLTSGEHRTPELLKLNPNGKVPTLSVDGTPMFEALAILIWLGDRYGVERKLWPSFDDPARLEAVSWSTWAYVSYGTAVVRLQFAGSPRVSPELHHEAQAAFAKKELGALLDMLEARLSKQSHILGNNYSLADLVVASVIGYGVFVGAPVDAHPKVKAWLHGFQARPAYEVGMKG